MTLLEFNFKCRFLDHLLSAVDHGEVRLYDGSILSFSTSAANIIKPRSLQDLHTLVTFSSSGNSLSEEALTVMFCFRESVDVGVVCSSAHEVATIVKIVDEAKRNQTTDFVHMKYDMLEDVAQYVRLRESDAPLASTIIPFPHTRLDFLRLATNRSVQCKLTTAGDSRIELTCDGVSVAGSLSGGGGGGGGSGGDPEQQRAQGLSFSQCKALLLVEEQQKRNSDSAADGSHHQHQHQSSSTKQQQQQSSAATMVIILSDQAIYVTENNGRVCGRLAFADISEVVNVPESSALYLASKSSGGGTLLISRFCPDIFTRMAMSGRLSARCSHGSQQQQQSQQNGADSSRGSTGNGSSSELQQLAQQQQQYHHRHAAGAPTALEQLDAVISAAGLDPYQNVFTGKDIRSPQQPSSHKNNTRTLSSSSSSPARVSMVEFATQTEDNELEHGSATTLYWMNQAQRLQETLCRRDVALRLAHQRYEALAASAAQQHLHHSKSGGKDSKQRSSSSSAAASQMVADMQRELDILRHYSRLLEEEVVEFKEAQFQQRIMELSAERLYPSNSSAVADGDGGGDGNSTQALKLALMDSRRHQALLSRKCDRLQSELQSVMINTDAALKELTAFVASVVQPPGTALPTTTTVIVTNPETGEQEEVEVPFDQQQQHQDGGGAKPFTALAVPTTAESLRAIVQDAVTQLEQVEGKVQSEATMRVAELKALNATLVVELRNREKELDTLMSEMSRTDGVVRSSSSSPSRQQQYHHNSSRRQNAVAEVTAVQSAEAKQRSLSRHVADLQQVRDQLLHELHHILEGAAMSGQIQVLQKRIEVLEHMHQFPLVINRVASLEAVASQCEAAKLQAKTMVDELNEKNAILSKRSTHNSSLQGEIDNAKKRVMQLEHVVNKETARREEAEKKAHDSATAHQGEIKELRKQVRYYQVRVQELLKRCGGASGASSGGAASVAMNDDEADHQQQQNDNSGKAASSASSSSPARAVTSSSGSKTGGVENSAATARTSTKISVTHGGGLSKVAQLNTPRSSTPVGGTMKKATTTTTSSLKRPGTALVGKKKEPVATTSQQLSLQIPTVAGTATTTSPAKRETHVVIKSPSASPARKPTSPPPRNQPFSASASSSSPEVFGVVEDPIQIARTRFSGLPSRKKS